MAIVKIAGKKGFAGAGQYFDDHLDSGDYHDQSGKSPGIWLGEGAKELGLGGVVKREDFVALTENINPVTGKTLTARMNTVREGSISNRRAFFDLGIAPPKSVSVAALVHGDERIIQAHNEAVRKAISEIVEPLAAARVRSKDDALYGGSRQTGNLVVAIFQHDTSRATVKGAAPDPQLHSHCVIMNATKDGGTWKALENGEIVKAQRLVGATYDHYLCQQLHEMGYSIREARNGTWELAHISDETCKKFSGRHHQIKEKAATLKAAGVKGSMKQLEAHTANFSRVAKNAALTTEGLKAEWRSQLSAHELTPKIEERNYTLNHTAEDSIQWAKAHCFERSAVVSKREFLASALSHARGSSVSIPEIEKAFAADKEILYGEKGKVSLESVLKRESFCVNVVIQGKEKHDALALSFAAGAEKMNVVQMEAAERLISSKDFVTVFRGGAGVGKSFALEHVKNALEAAGRPVRIVAPQNRQVEGLEKDGLTGAQTLSKFLASKEEIAPGSVIICDEAGQVAGKEMAELLAKAQLANARIILSGDIRQHGAVAASDALQGICKYAAPRMAEIAGEEAIMRQKVGWYRSAVYAAEQGDSVTAFEMLEKQGAVVEVPEELRSSAVAALAEVKIKDGSILILTQTNREVDLLNDAVRAEKVRLGQLDKSTEVELETLQAVDLSNAAKQQAGNYTSRSVLVPHGKVPGFKKGEVATFVCEGKKGSIIAKVGERQVEIKATDLDRLTVCERENLSLCKGDQVQLKANVALGRGTKLSNGSIYSFEGVDKTGCLLVKDDKGKVLNLRSFRQLKLGYAVTSYSGQGMTVDHVIISDSSCEMATSRKEFYVSISRGKHGISLLTSDKDALRENIRNMGDRELAMDMMAEKGEVEVCAWNEETPAIQSSPLEEKIPSQNVGLVGIAGNKPILSERELMEGAKNLIQSQQPREHHLDISQKIQGLLPKVPGFFAVFKGAGVTIQRAFSAFKSFNQKAQQRAAQIFK